MAFPFKYGKKAPEPHPWTLRLERYDAAVLPPPEERRGWEYVVPVGAWGMLGNDVVGDCVIAAMLHYIIAATANTSKPARFTTKIALALYSAITGYDPSQTDAAGNNPTDQGTSWTQALAYWATHGITDADGFVHKILGWAAFDYTNPVKLRQAIDIFGAALIGTNVTSSMEDQSGQTPPLPWNAPFSNDSKGGHGIPLFGFGRYGYTCNTWAFLEQMDNTIPTEEFDEAYVVITQDWLDAQGKTTLGYDVAALQADLAALKAA